jgi:putative membrane protein
MYQPVLDAVNDRSADVIVVFAVGAVIGLALFSTLLDRLLRDHHDAVMAALVGLMTGSMRVLWPWPDGADTARLGSPEDPLVPALLALTGLALVLTVGIVAIRGGEDAAVPIDDRSR